MKQKAFAHRERLAAVPSGGFIEVQQDADEDVGGVPEYMPLSLLSASGTAQLAPTTGVFGAFVRGTPQALSASGAVTITEHKTDWTTGAGAAAGTLADGVQVGQLKVIQLIVDGGGDGTLTPANFSDGATLTFADVGDTALLQWSGANWDVLDLYNRSDGATAPVVA